MLVLCFCIEDQCWSENQSLDPNAEFSALFFSTLKTSLSRSINWNWSSCDVTGKGRAATLLLMRSLEQQSNSLSLSSSVSSSQSPPGHNTFHKFSKSNGYHCQVLRVSWNIIGRTGDWDTVFGIESQPIRSNEGEYEYVNQHPEVTPLSGKFTVTRQTSNSDILMENLSTDRDIHLTNILLRTSH